MGAFDKTTGEVSGIKTHYAYVIVADDDAIYARAKVEGAKIVI